LFFCQIHSQKQKKNEEEKNIFCSSTVRVLTEKMAFGEMEKRINIDLVDFFQRKNGQLRQKRRPQMKENDIFRGENERKNGTYIG
jgi:hypothetical protein